MVSYARGAGRYTRVPRTQTVRLIRRAQRGGVGGKQAMELLIDQNMGLVHHSAGRYDTRTLPDTINRDDLIAEGVLGLMHAVRRFDPGRGTQFSTYAVWWVRQKMQRLIQQQQPLSTSIHIVSYRNRIARATAQYRAEFGDDPALADLPALTGLTPLQIARARAVPAVAFSLDDVTASPRNRDGTELADITEVPDRGAELAELAARLDRVDLTSILERVLPPRLYLVLKLRYGLGGDSPLSYAGISSRIGLTRQRAQQMGEDALQRLRQPSVAAQLAELLETRG